MSHDVGEEQRFEDGANRRDAEARPQGILASLEVERSRRNVASSESAADPLPDQASRSKIASRPRNAPRSLRARERGYSLWRSLFARNIHTPPQGGREAIEMTAPGVASTKSITEKHVGTTTASGRSTSSEEFLGQKAWLPHATGPRIWQLGAAFYSKARKIVLRIPEVSQTADGRHIIINGANLVDERTGAPYIHNSIRSSRYSLLSFFPRQLFAQFSKLANAYFLIISIMQLIPNLSTTGKFTTIVPLLVFIGISMAKEGWDDIRRWQLDKEENNRSTLVLNARAHDHSPASVTEEDSTSGSESWTAKKWSEIKVGDIVFLVRDDPVPADMILMYAEDGTAHMETMALDGETNLKNKQPPPPLLKNFQTLDDLSVCQGEVVVEDPSMDLYHFEGKISMAKQYFPLTTNEVLHRGSILRNTPVAAGIVCYTGEECRIRKNANKNPRIKAPALQSLVNKIVILIATFVLVLSLGCAFGYTLWGPYEDRAWYLLDARVYWGYVLTSFIIMFNTLLPLSLYVSMEIVKLIQILLMNGDIDMFDELSNTPMQCQTSTINEELGQVSYIFSDKTGTLTKNEMKVKKLSCGGYIWNHDIDLDGKKAGNPIVQRSGLNAEDVESLSDRRNEPSRDSAIPTLEQSTRQLIDYVYQNPLSPLSTKVRFLILSIALCHTCIPERRNQSDEIRFQATSPDELALVTAAQEMGYLLASRQNSTVTIKMSHAGDDGDTITETYEVLHVIEFTSSRKRMSIVVREPDGRICIHCKGADTVICTLLRLSDLAAMQVKALEQEVDERKSLEARAAIRRRSTAASVRRSSLGASVARGRSSMAQERRSMGYKADPDLSGREAEVASSPTSPVGDDERVASNFSNLNELANDPQVSNEEWVMERTLGHINDFANVGLRTLLHAGRYLKPEEYRTWSEIYHKATTSLTDREEQICEAANLIEKQFELIGATAVEDKLQDGVPDTIDRLRRANIKLWMLTGDKRETAISISRSCRLAKDYSTFVILDHIAGNVEQRIANAVLDISQGAVAHVVLVVDGETLGYIEANAAQRTAFLDLAILVDSVICCRASPSQKAMLVKSIRHQVNGAVTLAIGDGANDVAMIQEADVGIGISGGKEGLQAARTSDYAIAQFRFLCKLLLVHGRYNYDRISKYILATTYKEMIFYLTQALYQRSNGYTGTSLYESWSLSWYNAFFTSLPVIFLGSFMADLLPVTLLAVPELYTRGQRKGSFNFKIWLWWTFMATVEAMMVYFIMYGIYGRTPFTLDNGVYAMGVLTYSACVIVVNLKLQVLEIHNKTILAAIAIVLSVGVWFAWNLLLSGVYGNNVIYNVRDGLLDRFGRNALWWLTLIAIVLSFLLLELAVKALKAAFFPSDVELFQVFEKDQKLRQRFEDSATPFLHHAPHVSTHQTSTDEGGKAAVEAERSDDSKVASAVRKSIGVCRKGLGSAKKGRLR
jgi:phospholipid-translocating ATPase